MTGRRRTAVIGSGVAGLTAGYVLRRRDDVTLYEADDRLGGHAHTHDVPASGVSGAHGPQSPRMLAVDSGFIVHNERTYPHLLRLFRELGVATQPSEMSMSVRCEGCGLEYAGARGPRGLFARPRRALRPDCLRMFAEVPLFHRRARAFLAAGGAAASAPQPSPVPQPVSPAAAGNAGDAGDTWDTGDASGGGDEVTLGSFLARGGYSRFFVTHFAVPLVSAVWSCAPQTALRYPAAYLFRFLDHHGMLSVTGSPPWRTVTGGSREYVERIGKQLAAVRTGMPVRAVRRFPGGAEITAGDGTTERYDAVVLAVHPDQALRMLADPTREEREVLGAFRYSRNPALLHTDGSLLPRSAWARASWNYLLPSCDASADRVRVSYDLNRLQRLDAPDSHVVTLGGGADRVDPERVLARMVYEHPVYTPRSVAAQRRLPLLSTGVTAYAGAWHGWGFHEDGCRSGVAAARALGVVW